MLLFLKTCLSPVELYILHSGNSYYGNPEEEIILGTQGNAPETHVNQCEQFEQFGACF